MSDCPADKIIYDEARGEYICTETGEVLEERAPGKEWIEGEIRVIGPQYPGYGVGFVRSKEEEKALKYINEMVKKLGLPESIKKEVALTYREKLSTVHTTNIEYTVASCIYAVIRPKYPITLKEFVEKLGLDRKKLSRYYRKVLRYIGKNSDYTHEVKLFVLRLITQLSLPFYIQQKAVELAVKLVMNGRSKRIAAAGAVLAAAKSYGIDIPIIRCAKSINVSQEAIRSALRELANT